MKQKSFSIYQFKKGDLITRIEPILDPESQKPDYTLVGRKMMFLGIANASIYLRYHYDKPSEGSSLSALSSLLLGYSQPQNVQIPVELWGNGWSYYVEPDFLNTVDEPTETLEEENLQKQIDSAIKNEEFEKVVLLKEKLQQLKSKKS